MARSQNRQFAIGGRVRPPGESLRLVNRSLTDEDRRRRQVRKAIELIEERRQWEREVEGDWA